MPLIMGLTDSTEANGPGKRALIHFQGCTLGCKGCFNPQSHAFDTTKNTNQNKVEDWIKGLKDVEGITFSGGEPLQQAQYLYLLLCFIRKERPDLSTGMFSGYSTKELEIGKFQWRALESEKWIDGTPELWHEIKGMLDWAVLGRYNQLIHSTNDPLRGSTNQEVIFFTDRYTEKDLKSQIVEVQIDEDALVHITGFPNEEFRREYPAPGEKLMATTKSKDKDEGEGLVYV